ncbi:MAG: 30S ribosomal protein S7 [Nitrospirae bacterium]|nr:30S ribosomal protein S7 [Nitrospirota bacterium]
MSRKGRAEKREAEADFRYGDLLVAKLINYVMSEGKKRLAEKVVYGSFDLVQERSKEDPVEAFRKCIENLKPVLEVRPRRVGGATYQVPMEVRPERRLALALRWLIGTARERPERTMVERLAGEIAEAAAGRGVAMKKKEEMHKMAEANRAFAHYRW